MPAGDFVDRVAAGKERVGAIEQIERVEAKRLEAAREVFLGK